MTSKKKTKIRARGWARQAPDTAAMLLDDALAQFVLQLQADGRSPHTIRQYQRHARIPARRTADVGLSGHVEDLGHMDVTRFMTAPCERRRLDGRDKWATSVDDLRTSLRCFFGYLRDVDLVSIVSADQPGVPAPACTLFSPSGARDGGRGPPGPGSDDETADGPAARRDLALVRLLPESGMRLWTAVAPDVEDPNNRP